MMKLLPRLTMLAAVLALFVSAAQAKGPRYDDPKKVDADYAVQGEYAGELDAEDGKTKFGVQVIALGKGKFAAVGYEGGLPGAGWDKSEKIQCEGEIKDGAITFKSEEGVGVLKDGVLTVSDPEGKKLGELKKVVRKSPTLGMKPPKGAGVLFDGSSPENFAGRGGDARMTEDGLLMEGATSKPKFQDHTLHIEFRLPYMPEDRGQGRGNSGIYLQGRYEVQMLDSFGLAGKHNECGGIYSIKDPDVNMCFPPLTWQTYDIDFTTAKFDDAGKVVKNARMTIRHNGVVIHDNVELPKSTTAAPVKVGKEPGPVFLQNHGCPVRYRNIWVVEK